MRLIRLSILSLLLAMVLPVAAQDNDGNNGLIAQLLGGATIRENVVFRERLGDDYEMTVHGSRVEGTGYLEFAITDLETGDPLPDGTVMSGTVFANGRQWTYDATQENGIFLVQEMDFPQSGDYRMQIRFDGGTASNFRFYVYPSSPENGMGFALGNVAIPVVVLLTIMGLYMIFKVQFLPEPRIKHQMTDHATPSNSPMSQN